MAKCHSLSLCHEHSVVLLVCFLEHILCAFRNCQSTDNRSNQCQHVLFIDRQPVLDTVTIVFEHDLCKVDKPVNRFRIRPGTALVKSCRHIEVEHGDKRYHVILQTFIDEVVVVLNTLWIDGTCTFRNDTGPANRETIDFEAHFSHQSYVFLVMVVLVCTDGKVRSAFRNYLDILAGRTLAIFEVCAFYLISRSGSTPEKIFGKWFQCFMKHCLFSFSSYTLSQYGIFLESVCINCYFVSSAVSLPRESIMVITSPLILFSVVLYGAMRNV